MTTKAITRDMLANEVESAVLATAHIRSPSLAAEAAARRVVSAPAIAKATTPIPRLRSQVLQGISAAGLAQLVEVSGLGESLAIIASWFGFHPNPVEFSQVLTTCVTLAGLALAWYGRETTTRPLI